MSRCGTGCKNCLHWIHIGAASQSRRAAGTSSRRVGPGAGDNLGRERIPIPAEECPAAKVAPVPIADGQGFSDGARRSRMAYPRGCRRSSRKTPGSKDSGSATLAARSSRRCRGHSPTRSRLSGDSSSRLWQLHQASDRRQIDGGHQRAGVSTDVHTAARSRTKRQNPRPPLGLPRVRRELRQFLKLG
jgi:hypothetical protein